MAGPSHVPVLVGRVTALLAPALASPGVVLVDATLGRAGHARALLEACPDLLLIGIDADPAAIEAARELLAPYAGRVTLVHARYDEIPAIVATTPAPVMGLLFDLGVSSPQLDDPARGFAYAQDAPLDMRMDLTAARTAADIVNGYPAADLARVLRDYGEERFARRIADAVVRERARTPITSTARLSAIVKDAIPAATRRTGGNPAKRTFQALRIEVNDELGHPPAGAARRPRRAGRRRPRRGAGLPLARGPHRQAGARAAVHRPGAARPARTRPGGDRAVPPAHQGRRAPG